MSNAWIFLALSYGIIKGMRELIKKQALARSSVMEVLFFYTLIGFIFVLPEMRGAFDITAKQLALTFIKSSVIFAAWILSFKAVEKLPLGLYGVMDLSRVLFATLLSVTFLGEYFTAVRAAGFTLVLLGLVLVNLRKGGAGESAPAKYIVMTVVSCFLNSVSEILDKILMRDMTSGTLQFWYMLFMTLMYAAYLAATRTKVSIKTLKTNYWIIILSILFILGDRALFIANGIADSKVIVMTLIKQASVIVTILGGRIFYKEKNTLYRLICALVIVAGIVVAAI